MDEIGKQAAFYRAYLPHDRSLIPAAVALAAIVALWFCLYLVSARAKPANRPEAEARAAAVLVCRTGEPLTAAIAEAGRRQSGPASANRAPADLGRVEAAADPKSARLRPLALRSGARRKRSGRDASLGGDASRAQHQRSRRPIDDRIGDARRFDCDRDRRPRRRGAPGEGRRAPCPLRCVVERESRPRVRGP